MGLVCVHHICQAWLPSLQVLARRTKNNPILAPQLVTMVGLGGSTVSQINCLKTPIVVGYPLEIRHGLLEKPPIIIDDLPIKLSCLGLFRRFLIAGHSFFVG